MPCKNTIKSAIILTLLNLIALGSVAFSATPGELLQEADAIRNPAGDYKMRIRVKTFDSEQVFDVFLKSTNKTLIITKSPTRDIGRNMLMLDRDFYAYVPNLKRTMRLSLAQKLSGQVANGDIARTRWNGDYSAQTEGPGTDPNTISLMLEATKPNLTYQKIRLLLAQPSSRPLRAEYLALDGKTILKRAAFADYRMIAGKERPGRINIQDANQQVSTIDILSMDPKTFSDSLFTEKSLESQR